jgi:aspartyl-tRNA(Asn)/glutamyl-tRNA(Gln) amidotransferase subunit A
MPASLCGVVGLKPTYGRVSTRGLVASHNISVDHVGPLANTVADAALGLQAIAGHDPLDSTSVDEPVPDYVGGLDQRDSLHGLRIGVPISYFFERVDAEVEDRVRTAVDCLRRLGATLVDVEIPDLADMMAARLALFADGLAFHLPHLRAHPELYSREIRHRLYTDAFVQGHDHARALRVRRLLQERFARAFIDNEVAVLAAPTTPIAAVPIEQWSARFAGGRPEPVGLALLRLTAPSNLSGLPAVSVPAGFTSMPPLPVGLQLIGRPFEEQLLLQVAHVYEQEAGWFKYRPLDVAG